MMTFQLVPLLLFTTVTPWFAYAAASQDATKTPLVPMDHCEKGWIYNNKMCYLVREEYEQFSHAEATCSLFGAELAYGRNEQDLKFLTDFVGNKTQYGWWYGVRILDKNNVEVKNVTGKGEWITNNAIPLPKSKSIELPQSGCVGLHRGTKFENLNFLMLGVPCRVHLPYICRSHSLSIPLAVKNDKSHFLQKQNQDDAYWFSSPLDRLSYDDAKKSCRGKNMRLFFATDSDELSMISEKLKSRQLGYVDPWWVGLEVDDGIYTWSTDIPMDNDIIHPKYGYTYTETQRILLADGTMLDQNVYTPKAPFICMRQHRLSSHLGCPPGWVRAGQSCYRKSHTDLNLFKADAERFCSKTDSHLISFDTESEKQWFMDSNLVPDGEMVWTSLSDKNHTGNFTWTDGSPVNPNIETWQPKVGGNGRCVVYDSFWNTLNKKDCTKVYYPGCQYKVTNKTECVSEDWVYSNGYCYYLHIVYFSRYNSGSSYKTPFNKMLQFCEKDLSSFRTMSNETMRVLPLKIDSQEVLDLYSSFHTIFWTGLVERKYGVYDWADGTTADLSLFTNAHNGYLPPSYENKPRNCVVINNLGEFRKEPCKGCRCAEAFCEKEVPYPPADESKPRNGDSGLTHPRLWVLVSIMVSLYDLITK